MRIPKAQVRGINHREVPSTVAIQHREMDGQARVLRWDPRQGVQDILLVAQLGGATGNLQQLHAQTVFLAITSQKIMGQQSFQQPADRRPRQVEPCTQRY